VRGKISFSVKRAKRRGGVGGIEFRIGQKGKGKTEKPGEGVLCWGKRISHENNPARSSKPHHFAKETS